MIWKWGCISWMRKMYYFSLFFFFFLFLVTLTITLILLLLLDPVLVTKFLDNNCQTVFSLPILPRPHYSQICIYHSLGTWSIWNVNGHQYCQGGGGGGGEASPVDVILPAVDSAALRLWCAVGGEAARADTHWGHFSLDLSKWRNTKNISLNPMRAFL